jgi:hypothetical protein
MVLVVIAATAVGLAIAVLLWWGTTLPPTRPRPRSRYRGPTFLDVDRKLRRRGRR